jgi:hypothetical protein
VFAVMILMIATARSSLQASFLSIVRQVVCKGSVDAKLGHTHDKELDRSM